MVLQHNSSDPAPQVLPLAVYLSSHRMDRRGVCLSLPSAKRVSLESVRDYREVSPGVFMCVLFEVVLQQCAVVAVDVAPLYSSFRLLLVLIVHHRVGVVVVGAQVVAACPAQVMARP